MRNDIKTLYVDFDGTLVDSFDLINRCLCETVGHFKNIIIPLEKIQAEINKRK